MDCNLPGSSVYGFLQARILEWVAISFFKGSSQPRDQTCVSCIAGGFFIAEPLGKPLWSTFQLVYMYVCMHAYTQETLIYMYMHMCMSGLILMFVQPTFSIRSTYHFAKVHPLELLSVEVLGYKFSSLCKSDKGFILFQSRVII